MVLQARERKWMVHLIQRYSAIRQRSAGRKNVVRGSLFAINFPSPDLSLKVASAEEAKGAGGAAHQRRVAVGAGEGAEEYSSAAKSPFPAANTARFAASACQQPAIRYHAQVSCASRHVQAEVVNTAVADC